MPIDYLQFRIKIRSFNQNSRNHRIRHSKVESLSTMKLIFVFACTLMTVSIAYTALSEPSHIESTHTLQHVHRTITSPWCHTNNASSLVFNQTFSTESFNQNRPIILQTVKQIPGTFVTPMYIVSPITSTRIFDIPTVLGNKWAHYYFGNTGQNSRAKYPCLECGKGVISSSKAISCDGCQSSGQEFPFTWSKCTLLSLPFNENPTDISRSLDHPGTDTRRLSNTIVMDIPRSTHTHDDNPTGQNTTSALDYSCFYKKKGFTSLAWTFDLSFWSFKNYES